MLITKFSKDSKRGFSVGSNILSNEDLAAGAITLAAGVLIAGIGGLIRINHPKKKAGSRGKKKKPLWFALIPLIFNTAKSKVKVNFLDDLASQAEKASAELEAMGDSVEVIDAIPISSEQEVYDYI